MSKIGAPSRAGLPATPRNQVAWGTILSRPPYQGLPLGSWALDTMGRPLLGVKDVVFVGNSGDELRGFPQVARQRAGYQLHLVQSGQNPSDWSPATTVGPGCAQIRVDDSGEAYRVSYVASIGDTVYVLHCSQKESPQSPTSQSATSDIDLGRRYEQMSELIRARKTP